MLAAFRTCCVELWQCSAAEQHTVTLFLSAWSVVEKSRHTVQIPNILLQLCAIPIIGLFRHTVQMPDIMSRLCAILIILASFIPWCVELWQCVATVQHGVRLFVTECFVVGLPRHTVQMPVIMLRLCTILIILAALITCCVKLWKFVTTVEHIVILFLTACSVAWLSRHHGL
jgi:hypothetical protein